jgi:hypothetical protein
VPDPDSIPTFIRQQSPESGLQEGRDGAAAEQKGPLRIDGHDPIPFLRIKCNRWAHSLPDGGGMSEHIDAAMVLDGCGH